MTNHRTRRWFQWSLKSLFLVVLLVATFFAGYSLAERRAQEAMRAEQEGRLKCEATLLRLMAEPATTPHIGASIGPASGAVKRQSF
jgi:hypothetical protein